jgi:serine/threonine-protein kinase RsbW
MPQEDPLQESPAPMRFTLILPAESEALPVLGAFAEAIALEAGFSERARNHIQLALEEIAVNILMHGSGPNTVFEVIAEVDPAKVRWEIVDHGKAFAFEEVSTRYQGTPSVDQAVGGIGLFLVRKVMDEVQYIPGDGQGNRMILTKFKEAK